MRVLGVQFDAHFTFLEHIAIVKARCARRVSILRRLASTSWGCHVGILRTTYLALVANCLAYGIASWGPFVAEEHWQRINVDIIHPAARLIAGVARWTRIEALYRTAGVHSIQNIYALKVGQQADHLSRLSGNASADRLGRDPPPPRDYRLLARLPRTLLADAYPGRDLPWALPETTTVHLQAPTLTSRTPRPPENLLDDELNAYTPNAHPLKVGHRLFAGTTDWFSQGILIRSLTGVSQDQCLSNAERSFRAPRPHLLTIEVECDQSPTSLNKHHIHLNFNILL